MSAVAAQAAQGSPGGGQQQMVPFLLGSAEYVEAPFFTSAATVVTTAQQPFNPQNVTPGNFLDAIQLVISSTGGSLGTTASLSQDGALATLSYISLQNTGGGEILYPLPLFEYVMVQKYFTPWLGDPQKDASYSNSINPAITLDLRVSVKDTLAILSNTDARAQYRLRLTLQQLAGTGNGGLVSTATGVTAPTVTVKCAIKAHAQPPATDYAGRPIDPFPPGLGVSRKLMSQTVALPASGVGTIQLTLTGDEIRGLILIVRNSSNLRTDLTDATAGPIQFRLDNQIIWTMTQSQIIDRMERFYRQWYGSAGLSRETGVYAIPRFRSPEGGDPWLPTVEQSYLNIQIQSVGDVPSGTLEVIYDQLAVGIVLPPALESV